MYNRKVGINNYCKDQLKNEFNDFMNGYRKYKLRGNKPDLAANRMQKWALN